MEPINSLLSIIHIIPISMCLVAEQVVIYHIGLIASQYFKVLGMKDRHGFTTHTITSVALIMAEAIVS